MLKYALLLSTYTKIVLRKYPNLNLSSEYDLFTLYQSTFDEDLLQYIVIQYSYIVVSVATKFSPSVFLGTEDYIGIGYIGLLSSIKKFEPKRGFKFHTYATHRVHGSILDTLKHRCCKLQTKLLKRVKTLNKIPDTSTSVEDCVVASYILRDLKYILLDKYNEKDVDIIIDFYQYKEDYNTIASKYNKNVSTVVKLISSAEEYISVFLSEI